MKLYAGVDPGSKGHIALIDGTGKYIDDMRMPFVGKTLDVGKIALMIAGAHAIALERVWAMPGGGERKPGSSSTFKFGYTTGATWATLTLTGIYLLNPTAQAWQREIIGKRAPDVTTKEHSRAAAARNHPAIAGRFRTKVSADFADALHLAEYARRHSLQSNKEKP